MDSQMHVNLSKQTLRDELGDPALIQQIMCTADISSSGMTVQFFAQSWKVRRPEPRRENIKEFVGPKICDIPTFIHAAQKENRRFGKFDSNFLQLHAVCPGCAGHKNYLKASLNFYRFSLIVFLISLTTDCIKTTCEATPAPRPVYSSVFNIFSTFNVQILICINHR